MTTQPRILLEELRISWQSDRHSAYDEPSQWPLESVRSSAVFRRLQASNAAQHFGTQGTCDMKYVFSTLAGCCPSTFLILSGCTSMDVRPIPASAKLDKICIEFNSEVNVDDFVPVVQEDFLSHGISSVVYHSDRPKGCQFTMTYLVDRWWDLKPYMVDAQMTVGSNSLVRRIFSDECTILTEWAGGHTPVFLDFGADELVLWWLLHTASNGLLQVVPMSRGDFVNIHRSIATNATPKFDGLMTQRDKLAEAYELQIRAGSGRGIQQVFVRRGTVRRRL